MEELNLDQLLIDKIKKLTFQYDKKIPNGVKFYYKDILTGQNLETYMQSYSLSKEELINYARICKLIEIYKELLALLESYKAEAKVIGTEELEIYRDMMEELQNEGEEYLSNFEEEDVDKDSIDYSDNTNLLIYPKFIDESEERTINAHSGREEQTQKSVANILVQLNQANYQELRKKGYVHQVVDVSSNRPCYIEGIALERLGRGTTKLHFMRLPLSEKNREYIKKTFNVDFDALCLVVQYGDFKNEACDEKKYYNDAYFEFRKHLPEVLSIIEIFKNDFTPQTLSIAMMIINEGFIKTDELTAIIKNRQSGI